MSNVGFATLQILPSLKNLQRNLRKEADPVISAWAKDAGKTIGDALTDAVGSGVGDSLSLAMNEGFEEGERSARGLGRQVERSTRDGATRGTRDGVADGASRSARSLRTSVGDALRDGFKTGFRAMFSGSQDQGDRMRRSLALGVAGGLIKGAKAGFDAMNEGAKGLIQVLADVGRAGGQAAFAAITTSLQGVGTTVATGGLNLLVGALLAVAAAIPIVVTGFLALAPIVLIAGGVFGSLFTILVGGVAAVGVFALATHGLSDAFKELSEDGKISKETLKKLHPEAVKFAKAIHSLKKPFAELAKYVQGRLFDGFSTSIKSLSKKWLPVLEPMLGNLAGRFNRLGKGIMDALGKPDFIKNIRTAVAGFGDFIDGIGEGLKPFIGTIGDLAAAARPFLKEIGDSIGGALKHFSEWIDKAEKSGALKQFFEDAAQALRDIWDIGGLVFGIVKELIDAFFPAGKDASKSFLGRVKDLLTDIKAWLADPENKKKIQDFIDKIANEWIPAIYGWVLKLDDWMRKIDGWVKKLEGWGETIQGWKDSVTGAFNALSIVVNAKIASVKAGIDSIRRPLQRAVVGFNQFKGGAKAALDSVIAFIKRIPGQIVAALGDLGGLLYSAGANIVAGLARGMRENIGQVTGAGTALGHAARIAAEAALKVKSPSRVFMKIGGYTAEGMAIGINRGSKKVTKAINAMTRVPDSATASGGAYGLRTAPAPAAASGPTEYHLHDSRATIAQLEALQARQAILARVGRAR